MTACALCGSAEHTVSHCPWKGRSITAVVLALIALLAGAALAQPVNPDVTPETIKSTICVHGWSAKVRPPASVTNKIKFSKMDAAGIPRTRSSEIELDHVVSIELGGAPNDPANLRLQWWNGDAVPTPRGADGVDSQAHVKDSVETRLKRMVCAGQLELRVAQRCIFEDWRACAAKYPAH